MSIVPTSQLQLPPQNIEAEKVLLGMVLNDVNCLVQAFTSLKNEDFYEKRHQLIYSAILELYKHDITRDLVTLSDKLRKDDLLEKVGGISYLSEIDATFIKGTDFKSYLDIVTKKSQARMTIKILYDALDETYAEKDIDETIKNTEDELFSISQRNIKSENTVERIDEILTRGLLRIQELYINGGNIASIQTGFKDLDNKIVGLEKGNMVLIAARPSMGKTTLGLNICEYAAIKNGKSIAYFSLEMSKSELILKLVSSQAGIELSNIRTGNLNDDDWNNIARISGPLSNAKIYIDDTAAISVMEIKTKCRQLKMKVGLDLIIIDYLQLITGGKATENRQQEVSQISRSIKALAKDMDCPVIAISQLSRAPEQRADHRPILSDLRESGSIEQDADVVMLLYRDDYYNENSEKQNIAECIIAKQRNGAVGTVEFAWDGRHNRFGNLYRGN